MIYLALNDSSNFFFSASTSKVNVSTPGDSNLDKVSKETPLHLVTSIFISLGNALGLVFNL